MHATLEWSYRLLSDREQSILCRLSVIPASFILGSAAKAADIAGHSESEVIKDVLELIAKSLIIADVQGAEPRLRLPETTRAYARSKLLRAARASRSITAKRHNLLN
jgi:predicted ATPase